MIVKMIQNLENKMEMNSLRTRIEKMQEKFNKDLEIKKRQSIMNNAITEIKSTLEGTNSRITEAEDRISGRWKIEWWKLMKQRREKKTELKK